MRNTNDVALKFLDTRARWLRQNEAERTIANADTLPHEIPAAIFDQSGTETLTAAELEREMTALAWVLGVDPDTSEQRLRERAILQELLETEAKDHKDHKEAGESKPRVKLSTIRRYPNWLWLAEFPAISEGGYTSGYWAAFIAPRQLRELGHAIAARFGSLGGDKPRVCPANTPASYLAAERGQYPAQGHPREQP